jgi:hypothetical protein
VHSTNPAYAGDKPGCVCHTGFYVADVTKVGIGNAPDCVICHTGQYSAHAFDTKSYKASGHTTDLYGSQVVGAQTNFSASLVTTAGTPVANTWSFPTVDVFWSGSESNMPSGAIAETPSSIVKCTDCHTALTASGPHGANGDYALDPAFSQVDFSIAVLTHNATSVGGIAYKRNLSGGSVNTTVTSQISLKNAVPGTDGVICQKCHKLYDPAVTTTLGSNTAHISHHYDQTNGTADCINCHIATPHGWIRPRLLVNSGNWNTGETKWADPATDPVSGVAINGARGTVYNNQWNGFGMGSLSSADQHTLNSAGAAIWTENDCIACRDHSGVVTDTAKLK